MYKTIVVQFKLLVGLYLAIVSTFKIKTLYIGNSKQNWSWQYLTVSITFVLKSFIKSIDVKIQ